MNKINESPSIGIFIAHLSRLAVDIFCEIHNEQFISEFNALCNQFKIFDAYYFYFCFVIHV